MDMNVQDIAMKPAVNWKVAAAAAAIPDVAEEDPLQIKVQCGSNWVLPVLADHFRGKSDSNREQTVEENRCVPSNFRRRAKPFIGQNPHRLPTATLGQQRSRMGHAMHSQFFLEEMGEGNSIHHSIDVH